MQVSDTIAAISTPLGRGGLGVVRMSGAEAREIALHFLRFPSEPDWEPRSVRFARLVDDQGALVDHVLVTFFLAPRSYTGEDVLEISCHGSPVVLRFCLERAVRAGARLAEPGEFTLRAYLNGKIDLPRAEAVRDLIEATTLYQARIATQQIDGSVSRRIAPVKEQLLELIALLEAGIDFAEDDIDVAPAVEIRRRLERIENGLAALIRSFAYGKLVHSGMTLAIVGRPNVGKSSLFNRLLEQDRAIVTDIPGTTRDTVSEIASIAGIPVKLLDTAGIRAGQNIVETLGIERTYQAMADADLTLVVLDASTGVSAEDQTLIARAAESGPSLVVANKSDLSGASELPEAVLRVSALTGTGIDALRQQIVATVAHGDAAEREQGFITAIRHEELLRESASAAARARTALEESIPHEMLLLDLYSALRPLDAISGATTADDILNRIFSTFCIGK